MISDKKIAHFKSELLQIEQELMDVLGLAEEVNEKVDRKSVV